MVGGTFVRHGSVAMMLMGRAIVGHAQAMASQSPEAAAKPSAHAGVSRPLARLVTVDVRHARLEEVLAEINRQAQLGLSYTPVVVPVDRRVDLHVTEVSAGKALERLLEGTAIVVKETPAGTVLLVKKNAAKGSGRHSTGTIVGVVTDAAARRGIAGADVFLDGTEWRTTTDTGGRYRLSAEAGSYTLVVRRLSYTAQRRAVTVSEDRIDTVNVSLQARAVSLNDIVTTATGQQRRRDLGNAITTINADSVLRNAPIRNLTDLLQDRVPGLTVQHTSGAPGDPARLRLRGLGSLRRSNDPVVVVDGVRVYAAQAEARSGNLTNLFDRSSLPAPSPLDQIDPNIIEKVEVFKGPSAATLYGADAANGVIVITTRKGRPGPTRWHASAERGITNTLGRYPMGYYRWGHNTFETTSTSGATPTVCRITSTNCVQDSLVQFQALNEPALTPLGQGQRTGLSLTASGGTQALTYSLTGSYGDEAGLLRLPAFEVGRFRSLFNREPPDWMRRPHQLKQWSVTSNIGARLSATADVSLTASVGRTQQQRSDLESQVAAMEAVYVDSIHGKYYAATAGQNFGSAAYILGNYYTRTTASSVTFTTGLNGSWRPRSWLDFSGQAGINVIPRNDERLLPAGMLSASDSGTFSQGTGQSLVSTFTMQGNVRRRVGAGFMFLTNVGVDLTTQSTTDLASYTEGLVPGTTTGSDATGRYQVKNGHSNTSIFGWHIEPRLQGQRFSLSTGLRLDGGSAYGTRVTGLGGGGGGFLKGLLALPKLNGSWVISEEPWFPFQRLFSSLRLRGAYGQAQVQPGAADRLRLYRYLTGSTLPVDLTRLGNTQLRPERSTEFEGGFDADLLDSRVSVELTGYRKTQVDALMPVTLPPSLPVGGTVLTNIGTIRNTGVELTLRLTPVQSSLLGWSSELSYSRNHNELVTLGEGVLPNRETGIVAGYPVGGRWARPILGYTDNNNDGVLQGSEILIGDSAVFTGRLYPAYQMVLHSTVTLFRGVVNVTGGFSYDAGATQVDDLADDNWVLTRALADPSAPLNQQAAALSYETTRYGATRDISTFRFNELSIGYQAPTRIARLLRAQRLSVAVQGRNLALHSTYQGRDPDVNVWSPGEGIADAGQLAQPRTWQVRVDLDY